MIGARGKSCYTHDVFYAHYIQAMDMLWAFIIIYCTVSPHIFASELESAIIIIIGLEGVEWGDHVVWHGEKCYTLIWVFLWLIILFCMEDDGWTITNGTVFRHTTRRLYQSWNEPFWGLKLEGAEHYNQDLAWHHWMLRITWLKIGATKKEDNGGFKWLSPKVLLFLKRTIVCTIIASH